MSCSEWLVGLVGDSADSKNLLDSGAILPRGVDS